MADEVTDESLLKDFAAGRPRGLEELARRYEPRLLGLAWGLLGGDQALAFDAVQETWLRVIRFGDKFDGRSSFKTWLYRITINQCRNLLASRGLVLASQVPDEMPSPEASPEQSATTAEQRDSLRAAMRGLSEDKSLLLLLCYHEGMTHEQAAEILGIPVGTLKSRLHAALEELRGRLSPEIRS
ncbi:MAG TPA: sigma-70 family RNA polymerase sigma factor [Phycisphaerae bacterium]|nr:sigma-70 family RNA polymerase sigma factor [Phycisphaerae bacterium]